MACIKSCLRSVASSGRNGMPLSNDVWTMAPHSPWSVGAQLRARPFGPGLAMDFTVKTKGSSAHLFPFALFKGNSFLSCGATPSRPLPNTQPLHVPFPLQKRAVLWSQKKGRAKNEEQGFSEGVLRVRSGPGKPNQRKVSS